MCSGPIASPAPFPFCSAAHPRSPEDLQREIIDFDSEAPEGREFLAFTTATGLTVHRHPVAEGPCPENQHVHRDRKRPAPEADVLIVTWTVDEGHAAPVGF